MSFLFSIFVELFVLLIFEVLLEGLGFLIRAAYFWIAGSSIKEANKRYEKLKKLPGFDLSPNKQAAIVAILLIAVTGMLFNAYLNGGE